MSNEEYEDETERYIACFRKGKKEERERIIKLIDEKITSLSKIKGWLNHEYALCQIELLECLKADLLKEKESDTDAAADKTQQQEGDGCKDRFMRLLSGLKDDLK